ncbi:hypothetical protein LCGC14_0797720 [marine sediment metagenome]|uniref:Uncharacterized protein n=1 Tax=marine sediment metagenome TaxID=412755 RepID=A0A0F9SAI4_9ZZZZ
MPIYKNIRDVECEIKGKVWSCKITRILSDELKKVNNNLCYITKVVKIDNLSDVHLKDNAKECEIFDDGREKFMECK